MAKEPVLVKRVGKKKTSVFNCRKNKHRWIAAGGFETDEEGFEGRYEFRWCTCCGCLEEKKFSSDPFDDGEPTIKIRVPDTGI